MTSKPLLDHVGAQAPGVAGVGARETPAQLQAETLELRQLCHHLMALHEEEQARLARELHDGLGSSLTAVAMDLAWVQHRLDKDSPVATRLERAHAVLSSTVNVKRRVISELRPTILDNLGLAAAIESHVGDFMRDTGMPVQLDLPSELPELAAGAPIALFRIAQEALDNVARHAQAREARVSLHLNDNGITLDIGDDGVGMARAQGATEVRSFGLLAMRERALQVGATLSILAGPGGRGTLIRVIMPVASPFTPANAANAVTAS
jgi:signal transduction histidine kinase